MAEQNIIVINGNEFSFEPGETILDIAHRNSIDIPTLCHLKKAAPTGACRVCVVEVEGARSLVASCAAPAANNMVVRTESAKVVEAVSFFRSSRAKTILDLGCGTGRHAALLQKNGFEVYGCDSSASALSMAREMLPQAEFQQCDMGWLPYREECFDGIVCHAVIQHSTVAATKKTIAEIHRVLRCGGALFLTVISTEHPEFLTGQDSEPGTKMNIDAIDGDMPHHYFTESEMKDFFEGFAIEKLEHYRAPSEKSPNRLAATWALCARR